MKETNRNGRTFLVPSTDKQHRENLRMVDFYCGDIVRDKYNSADERDWANVAEAAEILRQVRDRIRDRNSAVDEEMYASFCEMMQLLKDIASTGVNNLDHERLHKTIERANKAEG